MLLQNVQGVLRVKHCVHFPDIDLCKEKGQHAESAQEARLGEDEDEDGIEGEA